ncbi:MAG: MFS transporter [Desulfobacterales bacterium]|nr:MFS transporter [Desulfobacterales bacterium]
MVNSLEPADAAINPANVSDRLLSQLGPLLILTSIFFLNFISRIILAPLIPEIEINFNLTHADAGALFFLISMGYFIAITGSGFISARLNHKRTIILSNTALGLALIGTAICRDVWLLRLGLFIVGMAAGLYLPSAISTLTGLINSRHWGKALAIHDIAPNLSFVAAPLIAEAIMARFSWRIAFILFGLAALVMSPLFARFGRGGEFLGEAPGFLSFRELIAKSSFWIMVFLFSLGICSTLGIYTMLPLYLVAEHAIDRNLANTLIALSRLSGLIMAFAGGWAADRFGPKWTLKIVFLITGFMTVLLGIVPGSYIPIIVFLQPLVAVCFFPAGFAALSFIVPPKSRNIAVSLTVPLAFLVGGGMVPIFIGIIGDIRSFALGIVICGGLITAGSIFTGRLKFHDQEN